MNKQIIYKPIKQKPYCCVSAIISMILDRRKIKHGTQDQIGYDLGLVVPPNVVHLFKKARVGDKPSAGYGTQINKKQYSINTFFKKNNIKLKETYYPIDQIKDIEAFLNKNLAKPNDIIACFNNKILHGYGDYGHVSLIQSFKDGIVTLIDPDHEPHERQVSLSKLLEAIKAHGVKNRAGFWVVEDK